MKNKKGLLIAVLILSALFLLFILLRITGIPAFLSSDSQKYHISIVDRGQVFIPIDAVGVVEPENEVILLSSLNSIIKKINKEPGSRVMKGEVIIELDKEPTLSEIGQINDQLEVKWNSLERSRLEEQMSRIDLDYNVEVKKLRIASIKSQLADEEQLLTVGGISSAKIAETRQSLVLAEKDLAVVVQKNSIRLRQLKTEEDGMNLQIEIQKKQLAEKMELLGKVNIKAPSDGIILTIAGKVGEKVGNDKMLVSMSDLTTFKIRGLIDEKYSEYIKTGNSVFAYPENKRLNGTIGNVTPAIADNKIQFNVHLDVSNDSKLIPNQTIKLQVLKSIKNEVLRIASNNKFKANSEQTIYILDSGNRIQRNVYLGMKGAEYQEIISGLKLGDKVIAPDSPSIWQTKTIDKKSK